MPPKKRKHRQGKAKSPAVSKTPPKAKPVPASQLPPVAEKAAPLVMLSQRPWAIVAFLFVGLVLITIGQFKPADPYVRSAFPWIFTTVGALCSLLALVSLAQWAGLSLPREDRTMAFGFGAIFLVVLLIVALLFPNPGDSTQLVLRVILALSAACVGAVIPGVLHFKRPWLRAGGATVFFVLVFLFNPAALTKLVQW
jgi:hypothetical protein